MSKAAIAPSFETFADRDALTEAAAAAIAEGLGRRLQEPGARARFAASGGSTPEPVYDRLSRWPLDWSRVDVTLGDERWVAPSSPDSNQRMLQALLLKNAAAAARLTPLWRPAESPESAAELVDAEMAGLLPFDVNLLGMGEDGHFASLFPGNPALAEGLDLDGQRLCIAVPAGAPAPPQPRISLTLRALIASRLIILLVTGEAKRRVLDAAMEGMALPVRALLAQDRAPVHILWAP